MNPFFQIKPLLTVQKLFHICHSRQGEDPSQGGTADPRRRENDRPVKAITTLDKATPTDVTFFHNPRYKDALSHTKALACFIAESHQHLLPSHTIPLITPTPYRSLAEALAYAYTPTYTRWEGLRRTEQHIFMGRNSKIGKDVHIGPNTIIGPGVEIGDNTHIGANVIIENAIIGAHCHIDSGAVIGDTSLSFDRDEDGKIDVPQIGCVRIGNDVRIGAQTIVDRGSLQDTVIGDHTAIGGLIHIAHNVHIGKGVTIISQTGIAGSATIGDYTMIGGQTGIAGHLTIGKNVQIAGCSGVMNNIPDGMHVAGTPAVQTRICARQIMALAKLAQREETTHA